MAGDVYILGLNTYDHDVAGCLLKNGEIVVAIAKERITRVKRDMGFFAEVLEYCCEAAEIAPDRLDLIVRNCYILPVEELEIRLCHAEAPNQMPPRERARTEAHPFFRSDDERFVTVSHHLAHAYSAFAVCPFDEGVVMVVDGVGSYKCDATETVPENDAPPLARESESYYRFAGTTIETFDKVWMEPRRGFLSDEFFNMPGLGALYSRVSTYVFGDWNKCGEVMGLAPYGAPGRFDRMAWVDDDGRLHVPDWDGRYRWPWCGDSDRAWERSEHRKEWQDLAWRVQEDTERALIARANRLHERTGAKNLCLVGGVALNCVANGKLVEETPFENVWIQPAAGDDGIAIGCAYYGWLALRGGKRTFVMKDAYLGRPYDRFDREEAMRPWNVKAATRRRRSDDVAAETAAALADGAVVGWFQGRSEFGPRALGNRSILADPRTPRMKDRLNARVKHRQDFRPFAPAVLAERAHEIFEGEEASPFMLLAKAVKPEWRDRIAGAVHVDGTARVQTVAREDNPRFHALIEAFGKRTGVPVLINTSFNVRGEPIVEMPMDAMACFLGTGIDLLVIDDWMITKRRGLGWLARG